MDKLLSDPFKDFDNYIKDASKVSIRNEAFSQCSTLDYNKTRIMDSHLRPHNELETLSEVTEELSEEWSEANERTIADHLSDDGIVNNEDNDQNDTTSVEEIGHMVDEDFENLSTNSQKLDKDTTTEKDIWLENANKTLKEYDMDKVVTGSDEQMSDLIARIGSSSRTNAELNDVEYETDEDVNIFKMINIVSELEDDNLSARSPTVSRESYNSEHEENKLPSDYSNFSKIGEKVETNKAIELPSYRNHTQSVDKIKTNIDCAIVDHMNKNFSNMTMRWDRSLNDRLHPLIASINNCQSMIDNYLLKDNDKRNQEKFHLSLKSLLGELSQDLDRKLERQEEHIGHLLQSLPAFEKTISSNVKNDHEDRSVQVDPETAPFSLPREMDKSSFLLKLKKINLVDKEALEANYSIDNRLSLSSQSGYYSRSAIKYMANVLLSEIKSSSEALDAEMKNLTF